MFVPLAAGIREVVSLPVFTVGYIVDPVHAKSIIAEGKADMVGMTRAHIADPDLVAKTKEGRPEDIRLCVGANVCIKRALDGSRIACVQNPEVAREYELGPIVPTKKARDVAVIGGGPGGLEAARVLAERGHRVVVYEANPILGGQFALRASIPNWHEFQSVINWRIKQLERNQVRIELGRTIKASDIHELEVDVIVLATGARPKQQSIPGEEDSCIEVATPHDVILNVRPEADKVVVWDHGGGLIGAGVIEELVAKGKQVTVITPAFAVAEDVDLIQRVPFYERVLAAGTKFIANSRVSGFDGTNVVIENIYSRELTQLGPVDLLVSWQGSMAVDDLRPAIEASGIECHVIGDGLAPRTAEIAIAEGMLAARNIA